MEGGNSPIRLPHNYFSCIVSRFDLRPESSATRAADILATLFFGGFSHLLLSERSKARKTDHWCEMLRMVCYRISHCSTGQRIHAEELAFLPVNAVVKIRPFRFVW